MNEATVGYNAEEVLDDFAYEALRKDQQKGEEWDFFSLHNPVAFDMKKLIEPSAKSRNFQ